MKKAIKDLCLVLGFVSMTLAADAGASQSNNNVSLENSNIENGVLGIERDIDIKLMECMKSDEDIVELVGRRYYIISQLDKLNKKSYEDLKKISETPLFCNLMPKDFATNYPGHPCLLSFIAIGFNGSYGNSYMLMRICLFKMLERIHEATIVVEKATESSSASDAKNALLNSSTNHDVKSFNTKVHADADGQGNSIFTILGSLYNGDFKRLGDYIALLAIKFDIDFTFSGPNGENVFTHVPGLLEYYNAIME